MAGDLTANVLTGTGQIQWRGLVLGDGTDYHVTSLTGWRELPGVDSGNVARPSRHGSWPGRALAQERTVTVEFNVVPMLPDDLPGRVAELVANTALSEDGTDEPLVVNDFPPALVAYGQLVRRSLPQATGYAYGIASAALQWVCSDPRLYSLDERVVTVLPPTSGVGGLDYPLAYPLTYGTPGTSGQAVAFNAGNTPTHPLVVIPGPAERPRVINETTGRTLEFDLTLTAADSLTVDCDAGTVRLNQSADRLYTLTPRSVPVEAWTIPPGRSTIRYQATSAGAAVTLTWRDAYL